MKWWVIIIAVLLFVAPIFFVIKKSKLTISSQQISNMKLTSPSFLEGEIIPARFTCKGNNTNPPLTISDIPGNAQSLVITLDDPDAPIGVFHHWLLWNISPATLNILEDSTPPGAIVGNSSAGKQEYVGPCPPSGSHRYVFTVYALDTTLTLPPEARNEQLVQTMVGHIIGQTMLIGKFP